MPRYAPETNRISTNCTWKAGRKSYKIPTRPCPTLHFRRMRSRTSSRSTASAATAQNSAPLLPTNSGRKSLMSLPSRRSLKALGKRGRGPRHRFTKDDGRGQWKTLTSAGNGLNWFPARESFSVIGILVVWSRGECKWSPSDPRRGGDSGFGSLRAGHMPSIRPGR